MKWLRLTNLNEVMSVFFLGLTRYYKKFVEDSLILPLQSGRPYLQVHEGSLSTVMPPVRGLVAFLCNTRE